MDTFSRNAAIVGVGGLLVGIGPTPALWAQRLPPPQAPDFTAAHKARRAAGDAADRQIATIHAGMTRAQLLTVFMPDSGLPRDAASPMTVFMYRRYPYLLVNVEFQAFHQPRAGSAGTARTPEDPRDVITWISRPFDPIVRAIPPSVPEIMSGHLGFRE